MIENKWQFVHGVDGGWWLRLTADEEVVRYIEKTNDRYDGALTMAINNPIERMSLEDRIKMSLEGNKDFMFLQAAMIKSRVDGTSLYSAFEHMQIDFGMALHEDIMKNGEVFINKVGGKTFSLNYDQFVWRDNLVFPCYTLNDIRIKQFQGGNHYYAYVAEMQLRDGEKIKWDSYKEAYEFAVSVINK